MSKLKELLGSDIYDMNKDDLLNRISEKTQKPQISVGDKLDSNSYMPTNYPELTTPGYNKLKQTINDRLGYHVNKINQETIKAALGDASTEDMRNFYGVNEKQIPDYTSPDKVISTPQGDINGQYYPVPIPYAQSGQIVLAGNDDRDATLFHELKHAHDDIQPHINIPFENRTNREGIRDNVDESISAMKNNDFKKMYELYSGDHFKHGSIPEDAVKFDRLRQMIKSMKPYTK
jgi:hypothetical protein